MTAIDQPQPPHRSAAPTTPAPERISLLQGDRLCIRCGFNLTGQTVIREPHYRMLMVVCPECSTPASLQEYPLLGRWASRWAAVLAAIWLLLLIGLMFLNAGILFGMSHGVAEASQTRIQTAIEDVHREWLRGLSDAERAALMPWPGASQQQAGNFPLGWVIESWWDEADRAAIVRRAGGWGEAAAWPSIGFLPAVLIAGLISGAVWAVFLLGLRRWRLMIVMLIPPLLAGAMHLVFGSFDRTRWGGWMNNVISTSNAGWDIVGWRIFVLCLLVAPLGIWAGAFCGRPLARLLARALLPPRMLGAMSFLWLADNKGLPRPPARA